MNWFYADTDKMTELGTRWTGAIHDLLADAAREIAATEHLSSTYFTVLSMGLAPAVVGAENNNRRRRKPAGACRALRMPVSLAYGQLPLVALTETAWFRKQPDIPKQSTVDRAEIRLVSRDYLTGLLVG
jgi:hypothetical protein